jgi:hypothetical protein
MVTLQHNSFIAMRKTSGSPCMQSGHWSGASTARSDHPAVPVHTVPPQVGLSLFMDFEDFIALEPAAMPEVSVDTMFNHAIARSGALQHLIDKRGEKR